MILYSLVKWEVKYANLFKLTYHRDGDYKIIIRRS